MATLSDLISRTRDRIGEPTEGYWTNREIRGYINEAARDISRRSEALSTDATLSTPTSVVPPRSLFPWRPSART